jgi:hypothetical protein
MGKKIFSKLGSKISASRISESALRFSSEKEKKLLESELIFGGVVDELAATYIEEAYEASSTNFGGETAASEEINKSKVSAQNAQTQARANIQMANLDNQINRIEARNNSQVASLEARKKSINQNLKASLDEAEDAATAAARSVFFSGKDGEILNYLVNGDLAMISPEHKALAKKFKIDPVVVELVAKAKAQLALEAPNTEMLKLIKYKLIARIEMLERLESSRRGELK